MKDLPILFSGAMVKAILEGRKTMTRRLVVPQPEPCGKGFWCWAKRPGIVSQLPGLPAMIAGPSRFQPGRRMWVRETWYDDNGARHTEPTPTAPDRHIFYRADGEPQWEADSGTPWRPSIHMPRWASRLTLRITAHRVERLHEITEADARAEGCHGDASLRPSGWDPDGDDWNAGTTAAYIATFGDPGMPVGQFRHLWDSLNGKRAPWSATPWVEVVSFERVSQ